jgi:uncharacterized protein YbaA (DUF1428 family)
MSYAEALLVVVLIAIAAVVATSFVRRALGLDVRQRQHEVGNPVYLQIGVVFAVLLAFVFNEVWGEYNAAAQAINGECGALHGAAVLAHDLPDGQGEGVVQAIRNYAEAVINVEWPTLEQRKESPEAVNAFVAIVDVAGRLNTTHPADQTIQGQILSLLAQAHAYRETRIFQANQGLPVVIWIVLSFYALILVTFVLFAGVESRAGHLLFSAVFATSVVLVLIVLRMLDYPFEGALTLSKSDFVNTIQRVNMLNGAG